MPDAIETRAAAPLDAHQSADALTWRERYFFDLYRVLEATALAALVLSTAGERLVSFVSPFNARIGALVYLTGALALFGAGRFVQGDARGLVLLGLLLDVLASVVAILAINGYDAQIAALLLVNVICGAILLPGRIAASFTGIAAVAVAGAIGLGAPLATEAWTAGALFAVGYVAVAVLGQIMRRYVTESSEYAERREIDLANLSQLNDLIIRRMRTGVIVVDERNVVHRINEAAWHLLGNPSPSRRILSDIAPELSRRLFHWRSTRKSDATPVSLAQGMPEVIPRFASLAQEDSTALVFLDDTSLLSRQAEQLTLSSLGRLSASVAHEVRNPLAAISYSAQLLSESEQLPEADQRLVEIIRAQCTRMNSIVENILQLSRRERSRPEQVELAKWVPEFVGEYVAVHSAAEDEVKTAVAIRQSFLVMFDPSHLHQVVWNLVQNAVRYGRQPDAPARVTIAVRRLQDSGAVVLEVVDRGPGIPGKVAERVFEPFFTTHEHGTGLGLYIARQLCEVNQSTLEHLPVPGGGSCFRIGFGTGRPSIPQLRARAERPG